MEEHAVAPTGEALPPTLPVPLILVADDEPLLRNLLRLELQFHGLAALMAANGTEALAAYRAHQAEVAVVLLDMNMPGLNGLKTLAGLRQLNPQVCCCLMSGHMDADDGEAPTFGVARVFHKPFALEDMAKFVWHLVRNQAN